MKVVVTGATGNVGTSVVEVLARDPEVTEIVGVARRGTAWKPAKTTWMTAAAVAQQSRRCLLRSSVLDRP